MKKKYKYLIFLILLVIAITPIVMAEGEGFNYDNVCSTPNVLKAIKIIGNILKYGKWIALMAIIVFGIIDFTRAITSDDEKALNKASKALLIRFVSGVLVVLAPTILLGILNVFTRPTEYNDLESGSDFANCARCLLDTNECGSDSSSQNNNSNNSNNSNNPRSNRAEINDGNLDNSY